MSQNQTELNKRLWEAAAKGRLAECKKLLRTGANVHATDALGRAALHEAAAFGHPEVCQWLIENGADVSQTTNSGSNALHFAAGGGSVDLCRLLVDHGADIHALRVLKQSRAKQTPLQVAVINGKADIVQYLVEECGEDLDQITDAGESLVELATIYNETKMAAFLPVYRNSIKTEQAVADALQVDRPDASISRSRGLSPI